MCSWYKFLITYDNILEKITLLQNEFTTVYNSLPKQQTSGATILTKIHRNGIMVYFSPNASKIAQPILERHRAEQCPIPTPKENSDGYQLGFSVGDKKFYDSSFYLTRKFEL